MKEVKLLGIKSSSSVLLLSIFFVFSSTIVYAETVTDIQLVPALDISTFAPYKIETQVSGSPTSVTTQIQLLNADGTANWDYYANGTPYPVTVNKTMTYDTDEDKYISENIYPDSIYPEIFFVPSDVTHSNLALETDIRRANYHLFHFANPLTITNDSSFFIEFNAKPRSVTSSVDLNVYLVKKDKPVTFFNSSWMNSPDVELVGTLNRNGSFHHTHSDVNNSQHNLISLASNGDATLGLKNIDVNNDFWIVLYSDATSVSQGWDLRYQPASFCTDITNRWYKGNKTVIVQGTRVRETFSTSLSSGCPDVHVHIARRGLDFYDSISPTVTATYADNSTASLTSTIPFAVLPNLAPNPTSFITPISGNVYSENTLAISWNPTTDPNSDTLNYTIYVNDGSTTTTLVDSTTDTTFNWDISSVADGTYSISGRVCDDDPTPLCTDFELSSPFVIQKTLPIYILENIEIYSNNEFSTSTAAKANDVISLEFDATGDISETVLVQFYSGGREVVGSVSYTHNGNSWVASYIVNQNDLEGTISYRVTADNLDSVYSYDTDIIVDKTPPSNIIASPTLGNNSVEISLNSSGCSAQKTGGAPELFEIERNGSIAKLFITPGGDPYNSFFVSYGIGSDTGKYADRFYEHQASGVMLREIRDLDPNQVYSFKVQPMNGCVAGDWSNSLTAGTKSGKYFKGRLTQLVFKGKSTAAKIKNTISSQTNQSVVAKEAEKNKNQIEPASVTPLVSQLSETKADNQKKSTGFFNWVRSLFGK